MNDYKELIENLRYYADACDRTNNGCQAMFILRGGYENRAMGYRRA